VEDVAGNLQRIFAGADGTAAMRALCCVRDARDRATATDAAVAPLKARTPQQFFGHLPHLGEADGTREREAGVTQSLAGSVYKQAARGLGRGHSHGSLIRRGGGQGGARCHASGHYASIILGGFQERSHLAKLGRRPHRPGLMLMRAALFPSLSPSSQEYVLQQRGSLQP
jgi:hypothetical protein